MNFNFRNEELFRKVIIAAVNQYGSEFLEKLRHISLSSNNLAEFEKEIAALFKANDADFYEYADDATTLRASESHSETERQVGLMIQNITETVAQLPDTNTKTNIDTESTESEIEPENH